MDFRLVIPAYREVNRLPPYLRALQFALATAPFTTEILIVDDGSPPAEQVALRAKIDIGQTGNCRVREPLVCGKNRGKGAAIMAGWREFGPSIQWMCFADADGAIPAKEVRRVFEMIYGTGQPHEVYFASRLMANGRFVRRPLLRTLTAKVFRTLVRTLIDPEIRDSQCGFKVIPAFSFPQIEQLLVSTGFCFDVELLAILRDLGLPISEVSVEWKDQRHGHINLFQQSPIMLRDLFHIRHRSRARAKWRAEVAEGVIPSETFEKAMEPVRRINSHL